MEKALVHGMTFMNLCHYTLCNVWRKVQWINWGLTL